MESKLTPRVRVAFGGRNQNNLDKSIIKNMLEENFFRIGRLRDTGEVKIRQIIRLSVFLLELGGNIFFSGKFTES